MGAERDVQATAMHSSVNWALLGLVIERPSYAYELAQRFERVYAGVLSLSSVSHAYTALAALKSRSLIQELPGTGAGRQSKARAPGTRYRATPSGIEGYLQWLVAQVGEDRRHQQLLVVQLAALRRSPQTVLAVIDAYERACLSQANRLPIARERGASSDGTSELLARLIAEDNRLAVGAKLAWIEYARRELKALIGASSERG
jgi:DNA-binding PadR family transcriptional regulator